MEPRVYVNINVYKQNYILVNDKQNATGIRKLRAGFAAIYIFF